MIRGRAHSALRSLCLWALCAPGIASPAAKDSNTIVTEQLRVRVVEVATGLEHPWSIAFLPEGRMLVTERPGRLRIVEQDGRISAPVAGVPRVEAIGQGGLLDVALSPDFVRSQLIFLSYAEPREGGNGTSVARARLVDGRLADFKVIFRQMPGVDSPGHFGSRLVFARNGLLFVTLGERQSKHFAIRAQDLESDFGKVVRLTADGAAPPDNPFARVPGARPEIWSYGHRNVQGAALHPQTGELWTVEHGPKGGDELNVTRAGANYGWPLVTHGVAYSGEIIGVGTERAGITPPIYTWVPSIATSGLAFYTGERFRQWQGNLFVGALYGFLVRLELRDGRVVHEERLLGELRQRVRDVRQGPDGNLYVVTDHPAGKLLRIEPNK